MNTTQKPVRPGLPGEAPLFDRMEVAHQATKRKKAILGSGLDGSAVVTFLADGNRGNQFEQLVYLELDVTVGERPCYPVRTGEYVTATSSGSLSPGRRLVVKVDPVDPQQVAVDWDRSLRL